MSFHTRGVMIFNSYPSTEYQIMFFIKDLETPSRGEREKHRHRFWHQVMWKPAIQFTTVAHLALLYSHNQFDSQRIFKFTFQSVKVI